MTPEPEPAPEPERAGPPAWDPLGAAPFAWDLPEPTPVQHGGAGRRRRGGRKSKVGAMTVAVALVTAPGAHRRRDVRVDSTSSTSSAWCSRVIGLGMVIGAFLRGGRGLIGLAVPLAVAGIGADHGLAERVGRRR